MFPSKQNTPPSPVVEKLVLLDLLARDRGHLITDDQIIAKCLRPLTRHLRVATSPASLENLKGHIEFEPWPLPAWRNSQIPIRLQWCISALRLDLGGAADVVFQSFDEVAALQILALQPQIRAHLILTNNLTLTRFEKHPRLAPWFLGKVLERATTVVVHCKFEVDLIHRMFPKVDPEKIFLKPPHQMAIPRPCRPLQERSPQLLFVGPELSYKPIRPLLDLIRADSGRSFRYIFCSMGNLPLELAQELASYPNVEVHKGYLSQPDYQSLFDQASWVVMTHDQSFEGRLSGVFQDAVAAGTPVIAQRMSPHTEFFDQAGPFGLLVDFNDPNWFTPILALNGTHPDGKAYQDAMTRIRANCGEASIQDVFRQVLSRV